VPIHQRKSQEIRAAKHNVHAMSCERFFAVGDEAVAQMILLMHSGLKRRNFIELTRAAEPKQHFLLITYFRPLFGCESGLYR
jgi:hypothetical protein